MKFKDFQAPVLFSSTFKALNLGINNSSTFKDAWEEALKIFSTRRVCAFLYKTILKYSGRSRHLKLKQKANLWRSNFAYSFGFGNRPYLFQVCKRVLELFFCRLKYRSFRWPNEFGFHLYIT